MPPQANARRPVKVPGHPGIFHKGSTSIDTWKERGKPKSRSYPTLTAAVRGRAQRIASGNQPASRERFDRYAPRWIDKYRGRTKHGIDEDTREEYRAIIDQWLIPYFRHTPLGDVGPGMVRDFIDHLCAQTNRSGEPLAPNTIRWIMAPLKAMLADAYENGLVTVDASRVRVVVSERGRARTLKPASKRLTREQTTTILAAIPERHRAASAHADVADPIFATKYGTHVSAHNIRRVLRPIVKDLGPEWVTPHVFRHSLATQLRDAGYDANAIARVLGHSDPSFTQRTYIHEVSIVRFDELFNHKLGDRPDGAEDNPEDNPPAESGGIA